VLIIDTQGQSLLDPSTQQKFVNPLPLPSVIEPTTPNGTHCEISMTQFTQDLGLKDNFSNPMLTRVWGDNGSYPGPCFEARRNIPITVKWKNKLMDGNDPLPHLLPVDT
jgi:spore coat protein A